MREGRPKHTVRWWLLVTAMAVLVVTVTCLTQQATQWSTVATASAAAADTEAWPHDSESTTSSSSDSSDLGSNVEGADEVTKVPLVVMSAVAAPDGFQRSMRMFNGQFPGPVIRVQANHTLRVPVLNMLGATSTSVHFHGMHQRGTPFMDGAPLVTQCPLSPHAVFTHEFRADVVGTHWYHSHSGGQMADGLVGPLIVDDPTDPYKDSYDEEVIVFLSDWQHELSEEVLDKFYTLGLDYFPGIHTMLINGRGRFDCALADPAPAPSLHCTADSPLAQFRFEAGRTYRLRIINGGTGSSGDFSVDGHRFTVIEADGVYTKPYETDKLQVHLGQRYSVLMRADRDRGKYWMRVGSRSVPEGLAVLCYEGSDCDAEGVANEPTSDPVKSDPAQGDLVLEPLRPLAVPEATFAVNLTLAQRGVFPKVFWEMNGTPFFLPHHPLLFSAMEGERQFRPSNVVQLPFDEEIRVILHNNSPHEHPFHMHGHSFQILGHGKGMFDPATDPSSFNLVNPLRRDTVAMPTRGWIALQFRSNNPGMWFFHCHNEWHLAMGLAVIFGEGLDHLPRLPAGFPTNCGNYAPHEEFAELYNEAPAWFRSFSQAFEH